MFAGAASFVVNGAIAFVYPPSDSRTSSPTTRASPLPSTSSSNSSSPIQDHISNRTQKPSPSRLPDCHHHYHQRSSFSTPSSSPRHSRRSSASIPTSASRSPSSSFFKSTNVNQQQQQSTTLHSPTHLHPRMHLSSRSQSAIYTSTSHGHYESPRSRRSSPGGSQPSLRSASHQSFSTRSFMPPKPRSADSAKPSTANNSNHQSALELVDQINRHDDLYHVLGFTRCSYYNRHQIQFEDIRKAYISRSRLCHPDKLPQYPPCTPAFQKLSFAYETLSKPVSRKLYDLSGQTDQLFSFESRPASYTHQSGASPAAGGSPFSSYTRPSAGPRPAAGFNADDTLNGVLHATFFEFMEGDFEMIRVVINALNEGNPGLNLGEEVVASLEGAFGRLRTRLLSGKKYMGLVRFELMKLYELQASLRALSYFNLLGRLRLSLALARVTISIPMRIDEAMKEGGEVSSGEEEEEEAGDSELGKASSKRDRKGILPPKVAGLLEATVAVLERGERATMWASSAPVVDHPSSVETNPSPSASSSCTSSSPSDVSVSSEHLSPSPNVPVLDVSPPSPPPSHPPSSPSLSSRLPASFMLLTFLL